LWIRTTGVKEYGRNKNNPNNGCQKRVVATIEAERKTNLARMAIGDD